MSRIGKEPVRILDGVKVALEGDKLKVEASGKKLDYQVPPELSVSVQDDSVVLAKNQNSKRANALFGMSRTIINNMIVGVKEGFTKHLEIVGRGKKAKVQGKILVLDLGFSHSVNFDIPQDIDIEVEKTTITIKGFDKQKVGEVAAEIRDIQPPEPYKGAGIRYAGEIIIKKAGKSAVGGGFTGSGK